MLSAFVLTLSLDAAGQSSAKPVSNEAQQQWKVVESVLLHPRCLNCHTATDYPRQGDDRHRHQFRVMRGHEGKGVPGALCMACHQATNQNSSGVPGGKGWHLAPLSMAWERAPGVPMKSAELCRRLLDKKRNGNMDLPKLKEHMNTEPLVLWAWEPGNHKDGTPRTLPPVSHADFLTAFGQWADGGAPCPK